MKDTTIDQTVEQFFAAYPTHTYTKKTVIASAGKELPGVLYLTAGRVIQYDISSAGNIIVVNIFKPGAFFPMSWAINKTPNNYFFEAAITSSAQVAPAEEVVAFLQNNPDVLFNLLSRVYRGTDGVLRRMAHLMGGSARSRLLFELVNSSLRFGESDSKQNIMLHITETDLAKYTGLARESVSRELQDLKSAGLLAVVGRGILIHDLAAIEALLGDRL